MDAQTPGEVGKEPSERRWLNYAAGLVLVACRVPGVCVCRPRGERVYVSTRAVRILHARDPIKLGKV